MDTNEFPRGQLNPTILSTMSAGDKYGYEIIEEIKEKTGIEIKQPSLYSSLKRMETQKLISSYWKDSAIGGKRHYYCLTNDGRKFLEENPVDFSLFKVEKEEETITNQQTLETEIKQPNESGIVLDSTKPVSIVPEIQSQFVQEEYEPIKLAEQENLFSLAKEENTENVSIEKELASEKPEIQVENEGQFDLFSEVDMANDDGKFITETIDDYSFPKFEKFEPATLNIEQRNTNYLSAKLKEKEANKEVVVQEKISDMIQKPFNHEKSMAKLQQKIDEFEAEKKKQKEDPTYELRQQMPQQKQKKDEFSKVQNTYVRESEQSQIFNSYNELETYYYSKEIGFSQYYGKEKSGLIHVNPLLIRFIRGGMFFIFSLIFAFAFYFGVKSESVGKVIYAIIPSLLLCLTVFYGITYFKSRGKNIIQMKKEDQSPIIMPMVAIVFALIIIAINLIAGFRANTTMVYFPVLIYPIILCIHIGLINILSKFIEKVIKQFKRANKYK